MRGGRWIAAVGWVAVVLLAGRVWGATAAELEAAKGELIAGQTLIAAGSIAEGQAKLEAVKGVAEEGYPARWQFAMGVLEAAKADKAGALDRSVELLKALAPTAAEADQVWAVSQVAGRACQGLIDAGRKPHAAQLVSFLEGQWGQGNSMAQSRIASLWVLAGDLAQAEAALGRAAGSAKTEDEWAEWADAACSAAWGEPTAAEVTALYNRCLPKATTAGGKKALVGSFVRGASWQLRSLEVEKGQALFDAVKADATQDATLAKDVQLAQRLLTANRQVAQKNYAGCLKTLEEAYAGVKGDFWPNSHVYWMGIRILESRMQEMEALTAHEFIAFLEEGPGTGVEQPRHHLFMANLYLLNGDGAKVEEQLKLAALSGDALSSGDWTSWAWNAYEAASALKTTELGVALYTRLAAAVTTEAGREALAMSRERYANYRHLQTVRQYLLKRDLAKAEEELKKAAESSGELSDSHWTAWGWNVWETAWTMKDVSKGRALYDRLAEVVTVPAGKTALEVSRVRYLLMSGQGAEAEGRLSRLPALSAGGAFTADILVVRYRTADVLAAAGNMEGAWRVFSGAWTEAQGLTVAQRSAALEQGFYPAGEDPRNVHLPALLLRGARAQAGTAQGDELARAYSKAAVRGARPKAEVLGALSEVKANPMAYVALAAALRDQGDGKGAQAVLDGISKEAVAADAELAKAVAGFWPGPEVKLAGRIKQCQMLVQVYEGRLGQARVQGNRQLIQRYEGAVNELNVRLAGLEKELAALGAGK